MRKYEGVPEMLEQFMQESGSHACWITVQELRDRFQLTRYQCTSVSGFLRRLEFGRFGQCPYIVTRIEKPCTTGDRRTCRYMVTRLNITAPLIEKEPNTCLS